MAIPTSSTPTSPATRDETGDPNSPDTNLNLPLPTGTTGAAFIEALDEALERMSHFEPGYLVVPFGADTAAEDPMGTFTLSPTDFHTIGTRLRATGLPLLIIQEGGYDVPATATAVRELLSGAGPG